MENWLARMLILTENNVLRNQLVLIPHHRGISQTKQLHHC